MRLAPKCIESEEFIHPNIGGASFVQYFVTHNQGRHPDNVEIYFPYNGTWIKTPDIFYYSGNGTFYNFEMSGDSTNNVFSALVYRSNEGVIKFKLFWNS